MEERSGDKGSNVYVAKRRVTITTDQTDTITIDFLEARDGRFFKSEYNMMIDKSDLNQTSTALVIISWLDFNDKLMNHPELTISES